MRYGKPSIAERLKALQAAGCDRILLIPLYPQYCAASTATVCDKAFDALQVHALAAGASRRRALLRRPRLFSPHRAADAADAELVIFSSAIKSENPILVDARQRNIPAIRRAEALAAVMRGKRGIVIAGMHGKTTTSAMAAHVLRRGGLHPSHYVGAEIPILGSNAHWDSLGEYFVAEGDESDGTLQLFHPEHALILNIEEEHLDFYADLAAIEKVFARLIEQTSGTIFYCADDANAARICGDSAGHFLRFRERSRLPWRPDSSCTISRPRFASSATAKNSAKRRSTFRGNTM